MSTDNGKHLREVEFNNLSGDLTRRNTPPLPSAPSVGTSGGKGKD
jgi:hypothetical protein